jgi:hypothetical protein
LRATASEKEGEQEPGELSSQEKCLVEAASGPENIADVTGSLEVIYLCLEDFSEPKAILRDKDLSLICLKNMSRFCWSTALPWPLSTTRGFTEWGATA